MKNIIKAGEEYGRQMSVADFAFLKICLFSLGVFAGTCVRPPNKKKAGALSLFIYVITFIPLMTDFFLFFKKDE